MGAPWESDASAKGRGATCNANSAPKEVVREIALLRGAAVAAAGRPKGGDELGDSRGAPVGLEPDARLAALERAWARGERPWGVAEGRPQVQLNGLLEASHGEGAVWEPRWRPRGLGAGRRRMGGQRGRGRGAPHGGAGHESDRCGSSNRCQLRETQILLRHHKMAVVSEAGGGAKYRDLMAEGRIVNNRGRGPVGHRAPDEKAAEARLVGRVYATRTAVQGRRRLAGRPLGPRRAQPRP